MGVYIKSMKMPDNCDNCDFMEVKGKYGEPYCELGVFIECPTRRPPDCPLVPVPPHGRMIDADALEELVIKQKYACAGASAHGAITELHKSWGLHDAELMIEAAPTIIPASEGEV